MNKERKSGCAMIKRTVNGVDSFTKALKNPEKEMAKIALKAKLQRRRPRYIFMGGVQTLLLHAPMEAVSIVR